MVATKRSFFDKVIKKKPVKASVFRQAAALSAAGLAAIAGKASAQNTDQSINQAADNIFFNNKNKIENTVATNTSNQNIASQNATNGAVIGDTVGIYNIIDAQDKLDAKGQRTAGRNNMILLADKVFGAKGFMHYALNPMGMVADLQSAGQNFDFDAFSQMTPKHQKQVIDSVAGRDMRIEFNPIVLFNDQDCIDKLDNLYGGYIESLNLVRLNYFIIDPSANIKPEYRKYIEAVNSELAFSLYHEAVCHGSERGMSVASQTFDQKWLTALQTELFTQFHRLIKGREVFIKTGSMHAAFPRTMYFVEREFQKHNPGADMKNPMADKRVKEFVQDLSGAEYIAWLYQHPEIINSPHVFSQGEADAIVLSILRSFNCEGLPYIENGDLLGIVKEYLVSAQKELRGAYKKFNAGSEAPQFPNFDDVFRGRFTANIGDKDVFLFDCASEDRAAGFMRVMKSFMGHPKMQSDMSILAEKARNALAESDEVMRILGRASINQVWDVSSFMNSASNPIIQTGMGNYVQNNK